MSATPWMVVIAGWDGGAEPDSPVEMRFITVKCPDALVAQKALHALNAFDALLAVAQLAARLELVGEFWGLFATLDAAHPGWREWKESI